MTPGCGGNDPNTAGDGAYDGACSFMTTFCALNDHPQATAMYWVWRRPLGADGRPAGPWARSGYACRQPGAPVAAVTPARPVITSALVQRAFRELRFARPQVRIQPEGNVTLVNLPTYYRVQWTSGGHGPDEVATVVLLGRRVQLRPSVTTVTYRFGDGHGWGPTADLGGTYPDGGVRHTYRRPGPAAVSVTATYTGQYALTPGAWRDVEVVVLVRGPVTAVQVKQARGRLIDGRR